MYAFIGGEGWQNRELELPVRECANMHMYRTGLHEDTVSSVKDFKRLDTVFLVLCRSGEVNMFFFVRIFKRATCLVSCTCLVERGMFRSSDLS